MKEYITRQQKNIFIIALVIAASISIFYLFIYRPKHNQIGILKSRLFDVKNSIAGIEQIIGGRKNLSAGILKLKNDLVELDSSFIKNEDKYIAELLRALSVEAKSFGVEVVSVSPSDFRVYSDDKSQFIMVDDQKVGQMYIEMDMLADFDSLNGYVSSIESYNSPKLVINKLDISRQEKTKILKAHLIIEVFTYMPQ